LPHYNDYVPEAWYNKIIVNLETWQRGTLDWELRCERFAPRGLILEYIESLIHPPKGPLKIFNTCNLIFIILTLVATSIFTLLMWRRKPGLALYVSYGAGIGQYLFIILQWLNALLNGVNVRSENTYVQKINECTDNHTMIDLMTVNRI
jgi:cellulose synthase/poly-beta-1,6-N-acetylglucosamine synthase-like glycosyltransferase